jgi:CelD/BcsL family acetyltransferase involved in cellulose biosynthesis
LTQVQLQRLDSVSEARVDWARLQRTHDNVFGTWEWASAWWQTSGGSARPLVYAVRVPRRGVVALLPLYVAFDRGVRLLRFVGHGTGDQLGPICAPADRPLAAEALRRLTQSLGPRYVLLAEGLRGDEGWESALGGRLLARASFPIMTLHDESWDAWLNGKSGHFRRAARRYERALIRDHGLTFKRVTDPAELEAGLDALVRLHRARWGSRSAVFESPPRRAFYARWFPLALERDWLRLWLADAGGSTVAAWVGFRYGGVESYYQGGRDPAWDRTSVGLVLLLHTIREALADGVGEYRFLRGDEPYKRRLQTADPGVATLAVGAGPLPALLAAETGVRTLGRSGRDHVLARASR